MATEGVLSLAAVKRIAGARWRLLEHVGETLRRIGEEKLRRGESDAPEREGGALNVARLVARADRPRRFFRVSVTGASEVEMAESRIAARVLGGKFVRWFRQTKHRTKSGRLRKPVARVGDLLSQVGSLLRSGRWRDEARVWPFGPGYDQEAAEVAARAVEDYYDREREG